MPARADRPEPDADLAGALAARDLDAVLALAWPRYRPLVEGYARGALVPPQDVDDIVQNVYTRITQQWATFEGDALAGWIFTITRYCVYDWRARTYRHPWVPMPAGEQELPDPRLDAGARLADQETMHAFRALLGGLDVLDQRILWSTVDEGCDADICRALAEEFGVNFTVNALRIRRTRLRERLRKRLAARGLR